MSKFKEKLSDLFIKYGYRETFHDELFLKYITTLLERDKKASILSEYNYCMHKHLYEVGQPEPDIPPRLKMKDHY